MDPKADDANMTDNNGNGGDNDDASNAGHSSEQNSNDSARAAARAIHDGCSQELNINYDSEGSAEPSHHPHPSHPDSDRSGELSPHLPQW